MLMESQNYEIERKWLITKLPEDIKTCPSKEYVQGYLCGHPVVRVRREGDAFVLTYKGEGLMKREEYELSLNSDAFEHLLKKCDGRIIRKQRHFIPIEGTELTIELDIYKDELAGLMTAEVEFPTEEAAKSFEAPSWFGRDVSLCHEYKNSSLALNKELPAFL